MSVMSHQTGSIVGIGSGKTKAIFGVDTVQALTLALHALPSELGALARQENGKQVLRTWDSALLASFIWIQQPNPRLKTDIETIAFQASLIGTS